MTTKTAAREFWIEGEVAYCEKVDGLNDCAIHTIEYSAYEALEAKVKELEAKLNQASFFAQASTDDSTK